MPDFNDALVRDVMTSPVSMLAPDTPLREAARKMYASGLSCFLIDLGDPARGHGILTQKDLLGVMAEYDWKLEDLTAEDAMSHPMVSVPATYNIETCMLQMRMLGVRRAAVMEGSEIVGLISFTDIFRHAVESIEASS